MPLTGDKKRAATLKAQRIFIAKEKKQLQATLDGYLDDVDIFTEWKDGKRVVTFDMGKDTNDALELVAAAQGKTLDEILRGVVAKNLKEAAKLKLVKDKHEARGRQDARTAQIEELRREQAALQAEIAKYEAGK